MAKVTVWFDAEGDFLEVLFNTEKVGVMRKTDNDNIMQHIDNEGNVIGFSILGVSQFKEKIPFQIDVPKLLQAA